MKFNPATIDLTSDDVKKAVSFYLTKLGYANKEDEEDDNIIDYDFHVDVLPFVTGDGFTVKATRQFDKKP